MNLRTWLVGGVSALLGLCLALAIIGQSEAQTPSGYSRDLPADQSPPSFRLPPKVTKPFVDETTLAMTQAEASELEYRKAIDANREKPGTVAESEIERLHRKYTDDMLSALRKQVQAQQAEINELRTVRVRPI